MKKEVHCADVGTFQRGSGALEAGLAIDMCTLTTSPALCIHSLSPWITPIWSCTHPCSTAMVSTSFVLTALILVAAIPSHLRPVAAQATNDPPGDFQLYVFVRFW